MLRELASSRHYSDWSLVTVLVRRPNGVLLRRGVEERPEICDKAAIRLIALLRATIIVAGRKSLLPLYNPDLATYLKPTPRGRLAIRRFATAAS